MLDKLANRVYTVLVEHDYRAFNMREITYNERGEHDRFSE